jgi:hypothetical protein
MIMSMFEIERQINVPLGDLCESLARFALKQLLTAKVAKKSRRARRENRRSAPYFLRTSIVSDFRF